MIRQQLREISKYKSVKHKLIWSAVAFVLIILVIGVYFIIVETEKYNDMRAWNNYLEMKYKMTLGDMQVVIKKMQEQDIKLAVVQKSNEEYKKREQSNKLLLALNQYYIDSCYTDFCQYLKPEIILSVIEYCYKWQWLAGKINDTNINLPLFMIGVCVNESNFNAKCRNPDPNFDGTYDHGVTQINDVCLPLAKQLPAELKGRNVKTDMEANIACRYIWIAQRIKEKREWALMDVKRGWKAYGYLTREK